MFIGALTLSLEKKFNLTRGQVAAIIKEEEILLKKYAHLELKHLPEHQTSQPLLKIVMLWDTLNTLVKLSAYQSDVRKTLFQRFQQKNGVVTTLINLIQTATLSSEDIELALRAQRLKLNTYHAPELFSKKTA